MPETKSYETVSANVAKVREQMKEAAERAGRDPGEITLVAATKVQTSDTIRNAIKAGITVCGENRVQELVAHLEDNAYEGAKVHFIGHLQTNKVKFVVGKVDMIESIDSVHLMDAVEKQAAKVDVVQDIMLEVNIGREPAKSGVLPEQLDRLLDHAAGIGSIAVCGLMAIPPISAFPGGNIQYFEAMYNLFIDIKGKKYDNIFMQLLSMGMSDDYTDAIACGANMVRVGSAIFGARVYH